MSPSVNPEINPSVILVQIFEELSKRIAQVTEKLDELDQYTESDTTCCDQSNLSLEAWKAAQQLSCSLDHLQSRILPPTTRIAQIAGSYIESKAVSELGNYRVADALQDGPLHLDELAQKVNAKPDMLERVLRTSIRLGLFQETEAGSRIYANNRTSDFLRSDHPRSQLGWVTYWPGENYNVWTKFHHALDPNQKRTVFSEYFDTDDSMWVHYEKPENRHMVKVFSDAMIGLSDLTNFGLVEDYDWSRHNGQTVADIGGGTGGFLRYLLKNRTELRGKLFDRAATIEQAKPVPALPSFPSSLLHYPELLDRVAFQSGNFFESVCPGADVYFMRWILHDWADSEVTQILKNIRSVIPPNGTLLIADVNMSKDANVNERFANQLDLMMAVYFWSKERSETEFSSLLKSSGFKFRRAWKIRSVLSIIEAVPC
ncbi:S-adenosyl-L-methionine-dependent methyltransferase [Basidiobolus meristosporus CBS 931.73]|uniref:S-adenosyl-L-methionine-dependent methyltransferase n=1 Tax=Basidiobolus meristosporus CBS 931.73 TaxID=1314790 RepID=A0A1Y1XUG6_9FUNG|nr:S-adenosyl-L-methionine-dependent methyltransferase [Basidiobolus meristosporus CBS 931.73]|eukprot:ORX89363.1 S-adenosyl-L-methionine-dependent methyltransferase [Basidiobolus meristosporus CBS 931.73]